MTEEQFEQLKQDPNLELSFINNNKKDLDSLYRIYLKIETKEKTTEKEKEVYGVEFKKGQTLQYPIEIVTNDKKELIYIIKFNPEFVYHPFTDFCKGIFFDNFKSARKYLELNIQQQINKAK